MPTKQEDGTRQAPPKKVTGQVVTSLLSEDHVLASPFRADPTNWWANQLRAVKATLPASRSESLTVVDLFCSVGGLSLGAMTAATLLGKLFLVEACVDTDEEALRVYHQNLHSRLVIAESVRDLVDFQITEDIATGNSRFRYSSLTFDGEGIQRPALLVGGPPCQGHSTLNNRTRSADPKNQLLLTMPAMAVALDIPAVVIENVPNVLNDSRKVVDTARSLFESHGYFVEQYVISATDLGWPQTRKRFFMVARKDRQPPPVGEIIRELRMPSQSLSWAIDDLLNVDTDTESIMDSVPLLSEDNARRVRWLFDNNAYDLPNHERPKCHQEGHSYPAVYGRMRWDEAAPTITGGFLTPGRGRFVHPLRPRVMTPPEAARVQGFPDWFQFQVGEERPLKRANLAKWIGDAVPPILGAAAVLAAIA